MTNRGKLISEYIEKEGINKSVLAKKILFRGKLRTYRTLLNKLSESDLSVDDVISFSKALNHNFLTDIPELRNRQLQDIHVVDGNKNVFNTENDDFKKKYYELLEEQNRLLKLEKFNLDTLTDSLKDIRSLHQACVVLLQEIKKVK